MQDYFGILYVCACVRAYIYILYIYIYILYIYIYILYIYIYILYIYILYIYIYMQGMKVQALPKVIQMSS